MRDEDGETEDNQTKKGGCEDFNRDEEQEDVESQYSLDDETIFTKAGISSTQRGGQERESDRLLAHWRRVCSEALLGVGKNLLFLLSSFCNIPSDFGQAYFEQ